MKRTWIGSPFTLAIAVAGALNSCTDSTAVAPGAPAQLELVAGNGQSGVIGTELSQPLVARVLDQDNHVVAGQLVNFRVTRGGGTVFAGSALTNSDGMAKERWTLGLSTADSQVVEARAVDPTSGTANRIRHLYGDRTSRSGCGRHRKRWQRPIGRGRYDNRCRSVREGH